MPLSIGLVGEIFVGSSILLSLNIHQTSGFIAELQKLIGLVLLLHGAYQTMKTPRPSAGELIKKNCQEKDHPIAMTPDSMIELMTKLNIPASKTKKSDKTNSSASSTYAIATSASVSATRHATATPSAPTTTPNNTPSATTPTTNTKPPPIPSPLLSLTSPASVRGSPHLSTPSQLLSSTSSTSPFSPSQTLKPQSTEKPRKYTYARSSPQSSSKPLPPPSSSSSSAPSSLPSSSAPSSYAPPLQPAPTSLTPSLLSRLGPNGPRIQVLCDVYRSGGCEKDRFVQIINEWAGGMAGDVLRDQRVF
ncbi:hypothetical protein TrVE_jg593 [Triparma verrucosa]|uniref:Uncharacterized protein n=1 Tax=Triparma verrucosa TaxID=1606542 RepID=A0A9W7B234_9STRA|nr:hypothetical protein TrVE_jg593 [Triparma verrucosa]